MDPPGPSITPDQFLERELEVDLTREGQLVLRWRQGPTVVALQELPRTPEILAVPALAARFEEQWTRQRGHFDAQDRKLDQAIVRVAAAGSFAEVSPVVEALFAPRRRMGSVDVSAFHVSVQRPVPPAPPREVLPDEGPTWKGPLPKVRARDDLISGRLPPEEVERVLATRSDDVRRCYMRGLRRDPKLEGAVQVRFVIGADGAVSHVGMPSLQVSPHKDRRKVAVLSDEATFACIAGAMEGLSFPRPAGGIVVVTRTYELSPR